MDRTHELLEQLTWHWDGHVRPKLEGLTDDEYLWEPVPGCWNLHLQADGTVTADHSWPDPPPEPPPFTTIAWRLGHVIMGVFAMRNASHFGGPPIDPSTFPWSPTAGGALEQLDDAYGRWVAGASKLTDADLARPVGPAEGEWADHLYSELLLHIHREAIHHGAEVLLLRDLYRSR